ncbi:LysR family transcriptional regulator [Rhodovibrionaceae bacterium A322]
MELRQLRTLVAIADYGSFAAAADAVGLTQSAVSLQIKHLEAELGETLFDRRQRSPQLNDKGQAVVEQARKVVSLCDHILLKGSDHRPEGTLLLGAVPTMLGGILPDAFASLRDLYPKLHIKVTSGLSAELAARTRAGDINAAVVTAPHQLAGGLVAHQVAREPLVVIAPPGTKEDNDRDLLQAGPFIQFNRGAWAGQQIDRHLKERKIRVTLGMEIDSLEAIARMVRQGLGVSVVPHPSGPDPIFAGLRWLPFGDPPLYRSLVVIEREGNPQSHLVSLLVEVLRGLSKIPHGGVA